MIKKRRSPQLGVEFWRTKWGKIAFLWTSIEEMIERSFCSFYLSLMRYSMGKTLQTIVTILDNRPLLQHSKPGAKHPPNATDIDQRKAEEELWDKGSEEWKEEMNMLSVPSSLRPKGSRGGHSAGGARAGTLVICPVIALSQWKTEIEKFSEDGALTVGTYHGPKRSSETPRELLRKYDVVLTTYQVLEADFRKMTSPNKVKCPNCGGKFKVSHKLVSNVVTGYLTVRRY